MFDRATITLGIGPHSSYDSVLKAIFQLSLGQPVQFWSLLPLVLKMRTFGGTAEFNFVLAL